nr:MAG TPA: hypothetical protein [Caudoviricetes sp.]DAT20877.1 MAG TPA: hypothetical protein [Caudoviricetes sp.]
MLECILFHKYSCMKRYKCSTNYLPLCSTGIYQVFYRLFYQFFKYEVSNMACSV